jgi:transcriptional regulator
MHPSARFHIADRERMADLVRAEGFGVLTVQTEAGLRAVHVPVLLEGDRLRFHVSRSNLVYPALCAGAEALFVANGPHAYISPDWYGLPDRVATWSYVAVELNGPVHPLSDKALIELLDAMSAEHEERLAPKPAWTRAAMSPGRFEGLLNAIAGFEMHIADWRGTAKIDQDKPVEVRTRIAAALTERGEDAMARLYSSPAVAGEGDRAQHGGGAAEAKPEPFFLASLGPSTTLRVVPLPSKSRGGVKC